MFRQGRIPNTSTETSYWQYMFAHAQEAKNVKLFEELLEWLRKNRAEHPRLRRYLPRLERQLQRLRDTVGG